MKNILVVDDSALMRRVISDIIKTDKRLNVSDFANNGLQAYEMLKVNAGKYDLMLLDVNMPKMSGLELLEKMQDDKINLRTIMVSTSVKEGARETIRALELGAFDFVTKPEDYIGVKEDKFKVRLLSTVCTAFNMEPADEIQDAIMGRTKTAPSPSRPSGVSSILGAGRSTTETSTAENVNAAKSVSKPSVHVSMGYVSVRPPKDVKFATKPKYKGSKVGIKKLVAMASSTGGPKSLQSVIPKLPANLDAPVLLVQHMPKGFTASFAQRLDELSAIKVSEAAEGDIIEKGHVYIAPGGKQMRLVKSAAGYAIKLSDEGAREGLNPCANIMYESLIGTDFDEITCAVFTGMGTDGTMGIGMLGERNSVYVISQDEATCVVYGMPKAVADAKLSDEVKPLESIAESITRNVGVR